jgi:hypothetical protein
MNLTNTIWLLVCFLYFSARAVDFNSLPPSEQSRIHGLTDDAFWKQNPDMDGTQVDPNSPNYSKWTAIRAQIIGEEFSDASDSENAKNPSPPTGNVAAQNQPAVASSGGSTLGRIVQTGNVVIGSGTVNAGDTWRGSFESLWDNSRGRYMKAVVTFAADDDTQDQVAMQFTLQDSGSQSGIDCYLIGKGGTQNTILYTPGLFRVSVFNQIMPNSPGLEHTANRNRSFQFRIEFFDPAPASDPTANYNQNPNQYKFPAGGIPIINSSIPAKSPTVAQHPVYSQPAQNPFRPSTPVGTATQPTSVAMPRYGNSSSGQSSSSSGDYDDGLRGTDGGTPAPPLKH